MKKGIALSFLFVFLNANTVLNQLWHLPVLIHHYLEHVQWDNNASFADFIAMHYSKAITHPDDEHHDHESLPFKADAGAVNHSLPMVCMPMGCVVNEPNIITAKLLTPRCEELISSTFAAKIWQPPKFC